MSPVNDDGPSILMMIGFVALVVATVILFFFGIGYLLGGCSCSRPAVHWPLLMGALAVFGITTTR